MDISNCEVDIEKINSCPWARNLRDRVLHMLDKYVVDWCKVVMELGENDVGVAEWTEIYFKHLEENAKELLADVQDKKRNVLQLIEDLMKKCDFQYRELEISSDLGEIDASLNFYQIVKELKDRHQRLQAIRNERQAELDGLLEKQKELCQILEKLPYLIPDKKLPKKTEIDNLKKYIEDLEHDKFNREETYIELKEDIRKIAQQLELKPRSQFEFKVLSDDSDTMNIRKSFLDQMEKFRDDLILRKTSIKAEIDELKKEVESLWVLLEESISDRKVFMDNCTGYTQSTLATLESEANRLRELKKVNIKVFVEKLREELQSIWQYCYILPQDKYPNMSWYHSDCFTEELLERHEEETKKWKQFYENNKKLLNMIAQHKKMWDNLLEMEGKCDMGIDRFKNRGGALLKEEKERNKLSRKIPILEEEIRQLVEKYREENGASFKIFNVPVEQYIDKMHTCRDMERKNKMSAKKLLKPGDSLTPGRSYFTHSSKMTLTPRPLSAISKKGAKPKIKEFTSARKARRSSDRLSIEKVKEMKKCMRKVDLRKLDEDVDYENFEKELSSRPQIPCRSTLAFSTNSLCVPCSEVTPGITSGNVKPPIKSGSSSKKVARKLKLIF